MSYKQHLFSLYRDGGEIIMSERFPDIDWYCDRCNAYLNSQSGFNDHKYIWECSECGHKTVYLLRTFMSLKKIIEIVINGVIPRH